MTCKVLHLITHLGIGGAQDNTLQSVGGLDRARYEVHLAAGVGEDDWLGRARTLADRVYLIPPLIKPISPWHDLAALRALAALMRQERYAIVHTHSSKAGALGRIAARLARVPLVIHTVHGLPWSQHTPAPLRLVYQRIEAYLARHSHHLITVAESNRQELIACGVAGPAQVTTIYSGIDCAQPQPPLDRAALCRALGLDPHKPIVGSVARLSPQKAPLDLLRAMRLVQAQIPGAQCVLVGDGPLRQEVEAAARDMGGVVLLGSRDDVAALLPLFDVFALSSHWEGLGRALSEALLAGLPAAVTAVNGVPELVAHGRTGLLSPAGRPAALADNIVWLLRDRPFAAQLGRAGRARVLERFTATAMVARIDGLYGELLARHGYPLAPPQGDWCGAGYAATSRAQERGKP